LSAFNYPVQRNMVNIFARPASQKFCVGESIFAARDIQGSVDCDDACVRKFCVAPFRRVISCHTSRASSRPSKKKTFGAFAIDKHSANAKFVLHRKQKSSE